MKVEKKSIKNLNYQKLAIVIAAIILIIVLVVVLAKVFSSKNKELNFDEFEKVAIYGYLEDNLLDVSKIYQSSGKSTYNELQVFQSKLKQALDSYFSTHSEKKVATSTILGMVNSEYVPASVDFHGIVVSDYEYDPETDSFVQSIGANANIAGIEADVNSVNYSDKKADVQKIEKTSDNKYKVSFNIVNSIVGSDSVEATGEAIISLQDDKLILDSCTLND